MPTRRRAPASTPVIDPTPDDEDDVFDDLSEEEVRQAEAGTLIRLQGPEFERVTWTIRRFRTQQERASDPSGEKLEWVHDHAGGLVGKELVDIIGGGTFHALGYVPRTDGRGVRIKYNETFSLAGPRKDFSANGSAAVAAPNGNGPVGSPDATQLLLAEMRREQHENERRLAEQMAKSEERMFRLLEVISNRPQPQPVGVGDLVSAVQGIHAIATPRAAAGQDPTAMLSMALDFFRQGVTVGEGREPAEVGGGMPGWAEKAIEVIGTVITRTAQRPPVRPPGARPPKSEVTVEPGPVNGTATQPGATQPAPAAPADPHYRWRAAADLVARKMLEGGDPQDVAASVMDTLNEEEAAQLRGTQAEDGTWAHGPMEVALFLRNTIGPYEQLESPGGQTYLASVLAAVRNPETD